MIAPFFFLLILSLSIQPFHDEPKLLSRYGHASENHPSGVPGSDGYYYIKHELKLIDDNHFEYSEQYGGLYNTAPRSLMLEIGSYKIENNTLILNTKTRKMYFGLRDVVETGLNLFHHYKIEAREICEYKCLSLWEGLPLTALSE